MLDEGAAVGADARLLTANSLRIQEASSTGESQAVTKDPATLGHPAPLGDRLNVVYKGTAVAQGTGRAVVTGVGMDSEVGAIAELLDATVEEPTPLQDEVASISRVLGAGVVAIFRLRKLRSTIGVQDTTGHTGAPSPTARDGVVERSNCESGLHP